MVSFSSETVLGSKTSQKETTKWKNKFFKQQQIWRLLFWKSLGNLEYPQGLQKKCLGQLFDSHHLGLFGMRTASDMNKKYSNENDISTNLSSKTDAPTPTPESI